MPFLVDLGAKTSGTRIILHSFPVGKYSTPLEVNLKSYTLHRRIPWWLVVLDEYADLTSDRENKKLIESNLKRLAQKARAAGIHVIIADSYKT